MEGVAAPTAVREAAARRSGHDQPGWHDGVGAETARNDAIPFGDKNAELSAMGHAGYLRARFSD